MFSGSGSVGFGGAGGLMEPQLQLQRGVQGMVALQTSIFLVVTLGQGVIAILVVVVRRAFDAAGG